MPPLWREAHRPSSDQHPRLATRKSPTHHDSTTNKHRATIWLEPSHAWLLHPAATHTSEGGARKAEERASFWVFKNEKQRKMFQEGGGAGVLRWSTPPGGFWQHTAPSWHDRKQKWSKLLLAVFKYNSVVLCPDKVAAFCFSDKFLHYHFLGPTIAASNSVFVSSQHLYRFGYFGLEKIGCHTVLAAFRAVLAKDILCQRVVKARNSQQQKVRNVKTNEIAPLLTIGKSCRRLSLLSISRQMICVCAQLRHEM